MEEKSAVALANFVPHVSQEVAHIAGLGTHHLMSWPDNSLEEEEEEEEDEQEGDEWEEDEQEEEEDEHEEEPLTFDDPWSDSKATAGGCFPVWSTPQEPGSLRGTVVEVHARESEVEEL